MREGAASGQRRGGAGGTSALMRAGRSSDRSCRRGRAGCGPARRAGRGRFPAAQQRDAVAPVSPPPRAPSSAWPRSAISLRVAQVGLKPALAARACQTKTVPPRRRRRRRPGNENGGERVRTTIRVLAPNGSGGRSLIPGSGRQLESVARIGPVLSPLRTTSSTVNVGARHAAHPGFSVEHKERGPRRRAARHSPRRERKSDDAASLPASVGASACCILEAGVCRTRRAPARFRQRL